MRHRLCLKKLVSIFLSFLSTIVFAYASMPSIANAATYFSNDFSTNVGSLALESKWQRVSSGGINNTPCIRLTYDATGTANHAAILNMSSFATNAVWVKFSYKVTGTPSGGSKFLKIFGSQSASMNNTTFIMDYFSNTLNRVCYYLDTLCETAYSGSTSGSCSPTITRSHAAINPADGQWHTYKVYLKRADRGTRNGSYRIFSDGNEIVNVTNVDNNPESGFTPAIDRIEWGGYRNSNGSGTWYMWVDDITVSDTDPDSSNTTTPSTPTTPTSTGTQLLSESFENNSFGSRGWYDDGASNSTIAVDGERGNVLEFSYPAGSTTPTGGVLRHLFTETDDITISYWIKYQTGWRWTGLGYGPHEFYLLTNRDDRYIGPANTHLTTYIESQEGIMNVGFQDAMNIAQSSIGVTLKGTTENRGVMGCNGTSDTYSTGDCYNRGDGYYLNGKLWQANMSAISLNTWHKVRVRIKLNSIADNVGQSDGIIQIWIDDVLRRDLNNVMIRTNANSAIKFNQLMIGPYFHNGPSQTQRFWIDDLIVTSGATSSGTSVQAPSVTIQNVVK